MEGTFNKPDKVAGGFSFYTDKDAEMAELERKKIEYLEARIDYSQPEKILQLYDKAIHDRIFKTPVGFIYLKHLQDFLRSQKSIAPERIAPIPLYQTYGELRDEQNPARNRVQPSQKKAEKEKVSPLFVSVLLNVLLTVAVIAMFVIALKTDQPNILNYEKAIQNRYATWEQNLSEREQIIREKERELKINGE